MSPPTLPPGFRQSRVVLAHTRLIHCAVDEMSRYRHEPMIETLAIRTAKEGVL
jgi:hypothetical protein